ncbi:MAG: ChaB family protein [Actinomycetota bacterium]
MADKTVELPQEANALPQGAQQIFQAAFQSATHDGLSEQAAMSVAWNSVKSEYIQNSDGSWRHKGDDPNITRKSIQSGGN